MASVVVRACSSCGRNVDDIVSFNCPSCGKVVVTRCKSCRLESNKYSCTECGFEGP